MASFFSVFVFFIYSMLVFHPEIEQGYLDGFSMLAMVLAEVILVLFSWFFIFYSMRAFLHARGKEFAILLQLGMERRQLTKLIFLETMIIGIASSLVGILFGYAFSRFFFMLVREILSLPSLPLYLSWEPFLLTLSVFLSAFIVISYVSVIFMPDAQIMKYLKGSLLKETNYQYSKKKAILGLLLIVIGYFLAIVNVTKIFIIMPIVIFLLIIVGTYFFFTDTLLFFLDLYKGKRNFYWKKSRILSVSEQMHLFKHNAKIFFTVCIVSTLAFISVGLLATLSSYTSQYDKMNPIGMIYKGQLDNPYENEHITSLMMELEQTGLSYQLTNFVVKRQTSSTTSNIVEVFKESQINQLLFSFGYPIVHLQPGEAMFIPHSDEAIGELRNTVVKTTLVENNVNITIDQVYEHLIFPSSIVSKNSIILNDEDFEKLQVPYNGIYNVESGYHLYTFDINNWTATDEIGVGLYQAVSTESLKNDKYSLPYYYENTGLSYSYILSTYAFFTLIGILVVAVFLLAAGSFVYFRLYTNLANDTMKFEVLRRIGLTDKEMKKLITRQLLPQFFLPWGLALLHSTVAFIMLQYILKDIYNLTIVRELIIAFCFFIVIQIVYFFLIRWRYIVHLKV